MSREATIKLLNLVDEGMLDKDSLIQDLLGFLSEDDVKDFCRANDIELDEDEETEEEEDEYDPLDDFNYVGSRHHY